MRRLFMARRWNALMALSSMAFCAWAGVLDYDAFCDRNGHIRDEQVVAAQVMVRDPAQLEAVYADAAQGNARAARVFQELESRFFPDIGREVAERVSAPECLLPVYRELSGACIPNWAELDFLRKDSEAGRRLRKAVADAFAARAHERGVESRAILSAVNALLAVAMVRATVAQAGRATVVAGSAAEGRSALLAELKAAGIKHDPDKLVAIRRTPQGKIVFLEEGNDTAGLQHILKRHEKDFLTRGIPAEKVPDAVMSAICEGKMVGAQGTRPIYEVSIDGKAQLIAVDVGSNGYVVGANPARLR